MVKRNIKLQGVDQARAFNASCGNAPFHVNLRQGNYLIDGKSIMGIFSLNWDETLCMEADTDDADAVQQLFGGYFANA
jgi:hypothetical protein